MAGFDLHLPTPTTCTLAGTRVPFPDLEVHLHCAGSQSPCSVGWYPRRYGVLLLVFLDLLAYLFSGFACQVQEIPRFWREQREQPRFVRVAGALFSARFYSIGRRGSK